MLKVFLENGALVCNAHAPSTDRVRPACHSHPRRRVLHGARTPQDGHGEPLAHAQTPSSHRALTRFRLCQAMDVVYALRRQGRTLYGFGG